MHWLEHHCGGHILNIDADGSVEGIEYVGGILGGSNCTILTISDSLNKVNVKGQNILGGIIGGVNRGAILNINNCGNKANISTIVLDSSQVIIGGIVGKIGVNGGATLNLNHCYNEGNIDATNISSGWHFIGGNVGTVQGTGTVSNCYNIGNCKVSKTNNAYAVGIICSDPGLPPTLEIINCYNIGKMEAKTNRALNICNVGEKSNCYYLADSTGEENEQERALSSEDLKKQSMFKNWDFENIWQINTNVNNGYPTLIATK